MGWAEDRQTLIAQVLGQQLPGIVERLDSIDPVYTETETNNKAALLAKAAQAMTNNQTYLDKATTTTAQDKAQIKALTRQVNALIRLVSNGLDSTAGT